MDHGDQAGAGQRVTRPAGVRGLADDRPDNGLLFAAVAANRMPMVLTDPHRPDNPIVFTNEAFVAMCGYPADEVLGRNCRFLQGAETDRAVVAAIREAVDARREISTEIVNYRKDGSRFWNALFISPVFDADGALVYYLASQLDVSRRRHAEEALAQAQKMEALGQLTGGIAHDFNNLLQVMLGHIEILDRRLVGPRIDLQSVARSSHSLRSAVDKAASLTQQLLAFARKQRLENRLTNLNGLTESMTELAVRTLGDEVVLVTDFATDLALCRVDPAQYELAILNVLLNARDAMEGRGTVRLRTENVVVDVDDLRSYEGLEAGCYVAISISDSGPGIPAELVHRVMEPFFMTKEEGRGTGLGLSMVHGFAKQSGGGVQLQSEVGLGTTIRLYFPAEAGEVGEPLIDPRLGRIHGGDETILVVDDRPEVLGVASRLLSDLGYDVISAGGGSDAVRLMASIGTRSKPVLLFSDVSMPGGMNGYMLARRLREDQPGLKILLTTGYAGDVKGVAAEEGGEFEVLSKPYRLEELARTVRLVLDTP